MSLCTYSGFTDSAVCASWVQAWGSIAAILAAVGVAYVQHRQNLRAQRRTTEDLEAQAIAAPLALAERAAEDLRMIKALLVVPLVEGNDDWIKAGMRLDTLAADLVLFDSLPIHTLPTYEAIHTTRQLSRHVADAIASLKAAHWQGQSGMDESRVFYHQSMNAADASLDFIEAGCVLLKGSTSRGRAPRRRDGAA